MFLTRSEYDRGVNTFSPEGRLFQVEYAIEAIKGPDLKKETKEGFPFRFLPIHGSVASLTKEQYLKRLYPSFLSRPQTFLCIISGELGSTAIGIQTNEGIVFAVEKRVTSPLMKSVTIEKIIEIDKHIGCAVSGLMADSRTLVDRARIEAQNHWFVYDERMDVESIAQSVSNLAIQFGDSDDDGNAMSRPFGVAVLFGGCDKNSEPKLFHMDPSGTYVQYDAKAIGSGSEGAQQALQEHYDKQITLKQALEMALKILKQVMEEKLNSSNVEVAKVTKDGGYHMLTKEEVEDFLKDLSI